MPVKRILVIKEGSPELVGLAAVSHQKLLAEYVAGSKCSSNGLLALPPLIIIAFLSVWEHSLGRTTRTKACICESVSSILAVHMHLQARWRTFWTWVQILSPGKTFWSQFLPSGIFCVFQFFYPFSLILPHFVQELSPHLKSQPTAQMCVCVRENQ